MTKLDKPVHREVTINGSDYIASLDPKMEFTLRKKRSKETYRQKMAFFLNEEPPSEVAPALEPEGDELMMLHRIKAKVSINPMDLKLKIEVLKAIDDLIEQGEYLAPKNWDEADTETRTLTL
tara:strand:- start:3579 stop:3944 length:366 start_codon:yes stop_codon:yes gene_type:complete